MFKIKRYSIGEVILVLLTGVSLIPVVASTLGMDRMPAVTFLFSLSYICILFVSILNGDALLKKNTVFLGLFIWTAVMFFRGLNPDYAYIYGLIMTPYIFLPFTFPFVVRLIKRGDIRFIYECVNVSNVVYLVFILSNISRFTERGEGVVGLVENVTHYLAFPNFLMMLSLSRVGRIKGLISVAVYFVGLSVSLYFARRGLSWTFGCAGMLVVMLSIFERRESLRKRIRSWMKLFVVMLAVAFVVANYSETLLDPLSNRLFEDSRGWVLLDFDQDMGVFDLIVGRGFGGTYQLTMSSVDGLEGNSRGIIESGYLNIVLYGGYVYLAIMIVAYLTAIYNGLFRSSNSFAKAFSAFILLHLLELYPAGVLYFNLQFLIIWICVSMCHDRRFISANDADLFGRPHVSEKTILRPMRF